MAPGLREVRIAAIRWGLLVGLMMVSVLLGWRANVTLDPPNVHYIPVPVRNTLASHHWYLRDWPPGMYAP